VNTSGWNQIIAEVKLSFRNEMLGGVKSKKRTSILSKHLNVCDGVGKMASQERPEAVIPQ